ncbi:MAG TPA: hypothetical protein VGJ94_14965 [Syntrophorhabdaceae bacterium]
MTALILVALVVQPLLAGSFGTACAKIPAPLHTQSHSCCDSSTKCDCELQNAASSDTSSATALVQTPVSLYSLEELPWLSISSVAVSSPGAERPYDARALARYPAATIYLQTLSLLC